VELRRKQTKTTAHLFTWPDKLHAVKTLWSNKRSCNFCWPPSILVATADFHNIDSLHWRYNEFIGTWTLRWALSMMLGTGLFDTRWSLFRHQAPQLGPLGSAGPHLHVTRAHSIFLTGSTEQHALHPYTRSRKRINLRTCYVHLHSVHSGNEMRYPEYWSRLLHHHQNFTSFRYSQAGKKSTQNFASVRYGATAEGFYNELTPVAKLRLAFCTSHGKCTRVLWKTLRPS
jgi:hypothetical protein